MMRKIIKYALGVAIIVGIYFWLDPYFAGNEIISSVAFEIGSISIHWYGLLIAASILLGYFAIVRLLAPKRGLDPDQLLNIVIGGIVGGIIGARLMFVLLKWPLYADNISSIFDITQGGLSIHGAVIGGTLAVMWASKLFNLNFMRIADVFVPAVILGQAIGRFGNFFNQEAFGGVTNLPWKMFISLDYRPIGLEEFQFFHPTFLYESIGNFIILFILLRIFNLRLRDGSVFVWYLISYSSLRFIIEFARIDSDYWGLLSIAQWASLLIILLGIWWLNKKTWISK